MFLQESVKRERAHGDAMLISADSNEAFEEVIWKVFYRHHYQEDRVVPWAEIEDNEFVRFFKTHIRKLIMSRAGTESRHARYVSKNNLNIARIGIITGLFRDAMIIVPFRHPLQHAASLLHQHLNFSAMHRQDDFARNYMAAIGHYDFGANLRPIDFDAWLEDAACSDPFQLGFWIEYWTAAYRHLLQQSDSKINFLSYDRLCEKPGAALNVFADLISIKDRSRFAGNLVRLKPARPHPVDLRHIDSDRIANAEAVHEQLLARSIC